MITVALKHGFLRGSSMFCC